MTSLGFDTSIFRPNLVEAPSATKVTAVERGVPVAPTPPDRELTARSLRLQIRSVQVMDGLKGIFGMNIGAATGAYLISTVVDGNSSEPVVFQGKTYRGVQNGDMLPLGPTPDPTAVFNVFLREGEMPRLLSFGLLVLRSNEDLREIGRLFDEVLDDERYMALSTTITGALTGANPVFGTIWQASERVVGLVAEHLKAKPDDQLAYYQAHFTNAFDNLGVGRHPVAGPPMLVDRVRFSYEINALSE